MYLGQLGNLHHFRCGHCGIQWHLTGEQFQEYQAGGNNEGEQIPCPVCRGD